MTLAETALALAARYDADFNPAGSSIVITGGSGATLTDADGHTSLDMTDIIANIGHCHPRHVAALRAVVGMQLVEDEVLQRVRPVVLP